MHPYTCTSHSEATYMSDRISENIWTTWLQTATTLDCWVNKTSSLRHYYRSYICFKYALPWGVVATSLLCWFCTTTGMWVQSYQLYFNTTTFLWYIRVQILPLLPTKLYSILNMDCGQCVNNNNSWSISITYKTYWQNHFAIIVLCQNLSLYMHTCITIFQWQLPS